MASAFLSSAVPTTALRERYETDIEQAGAALAVAATDITGVSDAGRAAVPAGHRHPGLHRPGRARRHRPTPRATRSAPRTCARPTTSCRARCCRPRRTSTRSTRSGWSPRRTTRRRSRGWPCSSASPLLVALIFTQRLRAPQNQPGGQRRPAGRDDRRRDRDAVVGDRADPGDGARVARPLGRFRPGQPARQARTDALQARTDEMLTLVARGGQNYEPPFQQLTQVDQRLGRAARPGRRRGSQDDTMNSASQQRDHAADVLVRACTTRRTPPTRAGNYDGATSITLGTAAAGGDNEAAAFDNAGQRAEQGDEPGPHDLRRPRPNTASALA